MIHRTSIADQGHRCGFSAVLTICLTLLLHPVAIGAQTPVKLYERVEETMTNTTSFANPFTETELRLDVTAPSGRKLGSSFTWYGFYDGDGEGGQDGDVWKFRMLFDEPGDWTVEAGFYEPGTSTSNGPSRSFSYSVSSTPVPGEHGHIRHDSRNPMRFAFDDGTPWVPFSVHGSLLLDREDSNVSFQWIDKHVAMGVDAFSIRFSSYTNNVASQWKEANMEVERGQYHWLKSDGSRAVEWPGHDGFDYSRPDVASYRHNEIVIEYASENRIKMFPWFGITGLNGQYRTPGPRDNTGGEMGLLQKLHIRYFLSRWAAYTCWWHWTVTSEWEETRNNEGGKEIHVNHAKMLRDMNPWKTLISNHSQSTWNLGGQEEGWGLATLQRRVEDSDGEVVSGPKAFIEDQDHHGIPVFNVEGIWQLSTTTRNRIATLAHLMAGGFSHISLWGKGHIDAGGGCNWPTVIQEHKDAAAMLGMLTRFFNRADIDVNPCVPSHDLVEHTGGGHGLCLAEEGVRYFVWVDEGGTPTLDLSGTSGTFHVVRYVGSNLPASDGGTELDDITGGGKRSLGSCPKSGFGNDYLFVATKEGVVANAAESLPHAAFPRNAELLKQISNIRVQVSVPGVHQVEVYSLRGDLAACFEGVGRTTYTLPASVVGNGTYVLRLRTGNDRETISRRLHVVR